MSQPKQNPTNGLTTFTTQRELVKVVAILALPVTATSVLQTLLGFVDTRMVSELPYSAQALDAIGPGRTSMWMLMSIFMGLGVGITAYVARMTGSGKHQEAKAYSTIGIIAGGVIGILVMALGLMVGSGVMHRMVTGEGVVQDPEMLALTQKYAWDYMGILLIGLGGVGVQFCAVSVYNSLGRTIFPMWLLVITNILNFAGNWYLIPRYEVAGSAWATTITTGLVAGVAVLLLAKQGSLCWSSCMFDRPFRKAWEMFKIGIPVIIQVSSRALAMLTIFKIITLLPDFGSGFQSALHVGIQAESLAFMPALAFSTSAATIVGQNLGAKRPEGARMGAMFCLYGSQVILCTMGLLFWFFPKWFIVLFIGHNAPEVVPLAANFLKIMAVCLPGLGVGMVMMGALRGSGDTQITAYITIGAMWFLRIPLVMLMAFEDLFGTGIGFGMGLSGIWWAMTISVYVEASLAFWRFSTGRWAKVQLAGV